jgi:hypothetical protein
MGTGFFSRDPTLLRATESGPVQRTVRVGAFPSRDFTMRKNLLRRKKTCCVAQRSSLRHRKQRFTLQKFIFSV